MKRKRQQHQNRTLKHLTLFNLLATLTFFAISHHSQVVANAFWQVGGIAPVDTDTYQTEIPAFLDILTPLPTHTPSSGNIRIGLESRYLNANAVGLGNQTLAIGLATPLNEPLIPFATLTGHDFRGVVDNGYYLSSNHWFSTFHEAHQLALDIGQGTATTGVVSATPQGFGVFIGPFDTLAEQATAQSLLPDFVPVDPSNRRVSLMNGTHRVLTADMPLQLQEPGALMLVGGRRYRGVIELGRHTGAGITPVNIVHIEDYLKSVVPSEMPASWHLEALKAQTIAARSFTVARRGSHNHLGYELCDTVFSQVYSGVDMEHANSTAAVLGTTGRLAWHGDQVILATYFSSSGGTTENSEHVWLEAVPYLRGVVDAHETGAMTWERRFTMSQLTQLAQTANLNIGTVHAISLYHADNGRVRRLTLHGTHDHSIEREAIRTFFNSSAEGSLHSRHFTMRGSQAMGTIQTEITTLATAAPQAPPPGISFENLFNNAFSGAQNTEPVMVTTYLYTTDAWGNPLRTEQMLSVSGWNPDQGSSTPPTPLPSLPPAVSPPALPPSDIHLLPSQTLTHSRSTGYVVEFDGRGWGHGVGMSQFGANSMANQGFTHVQILQHYYVGVTIR